MNTLIFCAGATSPYIEIIDFYLKNQIFTREQMVLIGVDGGNKALIEKGFIPDWAVGDFDSIAPPENVPTIRLPCEKNDTDLEAALSLIVPKYPLDNIAEILILGALGSGRLDHLLANIYLAHQARFADFLDKIHFVERNNSVRFFQAGEHILAKESDKKYLSFIGLTAIEQLTLRDVRYETTQQNYPYPTALISNEFLGQSARFSFSHGLMCVIQSIDLI